MRRPPGCCARCWNEPGRPRRSLKWLDSEIQSQSAGDMFVCICNAITESQIREAAGRGVATLDELREQLSVARQCGACSEHAASVLREHCARETGDVALAG